MSFIEAVANVAAGFGVALAAQLVMFPLVGIEARARQMLVVGLLFTVVSVVRSYLLRRLFVRLLRDRV
jgi:hypothetical protein